VLRVQHPVRRRAIFRLHLLDTSYSESLRVVLI
jgi:hypothetical protein